MIIKYLTFKSDEIHVRMSFITISWFIIKEKEDEEIIFTINAHEICKYFQFVIRLD